MQATARAHSNIALVKYWGKRAGAAAELNLPATGSLSMTLSALHTTTRVSFDRPAREDRVLLGGLAADAGAEGRVRRFLDHVRALAGIAEGATVESENNFPSASGLASSASAFAALALAASAAAGLQPRAAELSALARRGSGSAARSVFGGFVEMSPGTREDGSDAFARQLHPPQHWDLRLLAVLTTEAPKDVPSRRGMELTASSSPFYPAWLELVQDDLAEARAAVAERELGRLGPLAERNALRMHATALGADPPVLFWNATTVALLRRVAALRREGLRAWCTIDAGPHVKVLCEPGGALALSEALGKVEGVIRIVECLPGPDAALLPPGQS
jgi:diphosphomevalonate decarboxylase